MRVKRVQIEKFRSIERCDIHLSEATALIGENNVGKSAFLYALNVFFNSQKELDNFRNGHHQYGQRTNARITLTFTDIPKGKIQTLAQGSDLLARITYDFRDKNYIFEILGDGMWSIVQMKVIRKIKRNLRYILIPSTRGYKDFEWDEYSLLRNVVDTYLQRTTQKRDTVTPRFRDATNYLERTALKKISTQIKDAFGVKGNLRFSLRFDQDVSYKEFLNELHFRVIEEEKEFRIHDCGSGIQSLAFVALHRVLATLTKRDLLIGIEEPETNLHPQAQKKFINAIRQSADDSQKTTIVFTTHSTVLIDQIDHDQVVLFRKHSDDRRGFKTRLTQLTTNFWTRNKLEEIKYYKFHKYRNSDFFYAKLVIIVESSNDAEVVRILLDSKGIDLDQAGISILNLEGTENLKYPFLLLRELEIPYFLILDKDYFLPYSNDELDSSRNSSGFPKYRYEYKPDNLINKIIPNRTDKEELLKLFASNHSRALDLLEKYNIVCMLFALEIDLVASRTAANLYYRHLNVPIGSKTTHELLVVRRKQIKRLDNLLHVVGNTPHRNLPNSYKRIKRVIPNIIKQIT